MVDALVSNDLLEYDRVKSEEGKRTRDKYYLRVKHGSEDTFEDLMSLVDSPENEISVYTRPQFHKPHPFVRFQNPEAGYLVRNANPAAVKSFNQATCPMVFDVINQTHEHILQHQLGVVRYI